MTKRINKILWNGTEVPQAATRADGLDGLNLGELFIKNDPQEPGIYTRTTDGKVVLLGGGGSGTSELVDWNSIVNKPTKVSYFINDAGYATTSDIDTRIDALVNGAPQAYDTLKEIADVLANNINSIDDILTALGTKVSKDDFNTAIANVNNSISALNTELSGKIDLKLDAVTFNELFEKVQLEDGTWAIKAKLGLFSDGFISAKGSNVGGTSSEGGAVALYQLNDVLADGTGVSGAQHGAVFVYDATIGKWKGVAQSEIVPNLTGYAKESWVLSQGFLTEHQDLSDYAKLTDIPTIPTTDINKGVTAYGWGDHSKVGYLTSHQSLDGYVNEIATSGNGNAITSVSKDGKKITFTKGATYLTGITSKLVTDALGYTPYDAANFTKAKIKSTLGISDWALASSKPSYKFSEITDNPTTLSGYGITDAYTKSQVDSALGGYLPLSGGTITSSTAPLTIDRLSSSLTNIVFEKNGVTSGVIGFDKNDNFVIRDKFSSNSTYHSVIHSGNIGSQSVASADKLSDNGSYTAWGQTFFTNGKPKSLSGALTDVTDITSSGTITTNKIVIGNGTIEWDEANKGFKVTGLYSTTYLSAKGANTNGGSTPSGGQYTRLDSWDGYTSAMDGWVLSAKLGKGLYDTQNSLITRVGALEGKATNVSFTQSLTSGTQIGSISIDGVAKNIYAPTIPTDDINKGVTAYGWGNHANVGYAMASALGGYLPLSGGTIEIITDEGLSVNRTNGTRALISFKVDGGYKGGLGIDTDGVPLYRTYAGGINTLIHSGNYTDYTYSQSTIDTKLGGYLPLSGGTLSAWGNPLTIERTDGASPSIGFLGVSGAIGAIGVDYNNEPFFYRSSNKTTYFLIHAGNIGSQSVASAEKLTTARSIWGQSFDGTGDVSGTLSNVGNIYFGANNTYNIGSNTNQVLYIYTKWIGSQTNSTFAIGAANAYHLNILTNGNVGIGTTSPQYKLDVNGALNAGVYYASITNSIGKNTSGHFRWGKFDEVGGLKLQFGAESGANLAIINSAWNKALFVVDTEGNVTASGTIHSNIGIFSDGYVSAKGQNTSSDMRLKNVLNEVVLNVSDIANAPSIRFAWKNGGGIDVGSSAQYWQGLLPDAVKERDGMLEMQYANIALLSAIAIAKNVETHEERIARLEKENKELRTKIDMMERGIE